MFLYKYNRNETYTSASQPASFSSTHFVVGQNVLNTFGMRVSNLLKASSCMSDENEEEEEKEEPNSLHVYC